MKDEYLVYWKEVLGMYGNPFAKHNERLPGFDGFNPFGYDIYVTPQTIEGSFYESDLYRRDSHVVFVGNSGEGLSTLAMGHCGRGRCANNRILYVHQWDKRDLKESLARDLFLQSLEKCDYGIINPDLMHKKDIDLIATYIPNIARVIGKKRIDIEDEVVDMFYTLGSYYTSYVGLTPQKKAWLNRFGGGRSLGRKPGDMRGLLDLAGRVGFERVEFVVDLSGDGCNSMPNIPRSVDDGIKVVSRVFTPTQKLSGVSPKLRTYGIDYKVININWNEDDLGCVIADRFRVGGSGITTLDSLSPQVLLEYADCGLQHLLISMCNGSPRLLIQLIDRLFDIKCSRDINDPIIDLQDYESLLAETSK